MAIGWAIVSTGRHVNDWVAPAMAGAVDTQLVAVYSRDQGRAEAFTRKHGAQVAYTSLEALVADARVEAVFIAAPNFLHAPYTTIAAQAGKHVLVEKPMAVQVDEAVEMVRTCQAHGVKLGVGFHLRYHPGHQEARRLTLDSSFRVLKRVDAYLRLSVRRKQRVALRVARERQGTRLLGRDVELVGAVAQPCNADAGMDPVDGGHDVLDSVEKIE